MKEIPMSEFRRKAGEYVNQTHYAQKVFFLTKGDQRMAALVPVSVLDRLIELEALYKTDNPEPTADPNGTEGKT